MASKRTLFLLAKILQGPSQTRLIRKGSLYNNHGNTLLKNIVRIDHGEGAGWPRIQSMTF